MAASLSPEDALVQAEKELAKANRRLAESIQMGDYYGHGHWSKEAKMIRMKIDGLKQLIQAKPSRPPVTAFSKAISTIQNDMITDQFQSMSYQPRFSFTNQISSYWEKQFLQSAQQSFLYNQNGLRPMPNQPLSQPPQSSPPMKQEPEFKVGDIVGVTGFTDIHWRIVRVNKDSYRVSPHAGLNGVDISDFVDDTFNFDRCTLVEPPAPKVIVDFDTVIIDDEKRQQILEALEQVNQADLIFKVWGFDQTMEKGKGVSMLFFGPPGTGKTLMAQAIANKLGYSLKIITTADVQSSAPGEAERNIRKHFKEAKGGKTILLFDECDSMIYTRENVGPIMGAQINELLSQIERFDGITLFTTNRLGTLDEAVNRRLALKLEFTMPTPEERVEIWQRMFPESAPVASDVDWLGLASVEMTGGYIKNAVLRAARMAATEKVHDSKKQITMRHLVRALKHEVESMDKFDAARTVERAGYGHIHMNESGQAEITRG